MSDIEWHEEVWPIEKIKGYDRNPRKISKEQFDRLTRAIQEVGFHHPIAVDVDGTIISGNQRFRALNQLGEKTVRVSLPSRKLTKGEFKQIVIQANISNGEWDTDILACDFDVEKLIDWGIPENQLGVQQEERGGGSMSVTCPECGAEFDAKGNVSRK